MRALVSESLAEEGLLRLREQCEVDYRPEMNREELLATIGRYEGLVVRSATQVTADIIAAGDRLRVIGRAGVGVNNIDLEAATARGIVVLNVPDGNTIAACEHTFALMLALARNVPAAAASLAQGHWDRHKFTGIQLYGKTLGLVGLGRIGREVGKRAVAFGMDVIGYDPYASPAQVAKLGIRLASLDEVLAQADFLSIHSPLTPQTRKMIGAKQLAALKQGARVVNCARGGIVDEKALGQALTSGHLAGAAVDVFEKEPPPADHPLLGLANVVVTPHLGASTVEAQVICAIEVADQVARYLAGLPVRNAVNLPAISEQEWEEIEPLLPLAEIIGRLFTQALPGPLESVEVAVHGSLDGRAADIVANATLVGLLAGIVEGPVNQVNAGLIAGQQGISLGVRRMGDDEARPTMVELTGGTQGRRKSISGYLSPLGQPRIAEIDGLKLDMAPTRHMLMDFHQDRPGIIGRIGTILGDHRINIAAMQVGRRDAGGEAVMVVAVDDPVPDEVLLELRQVPSVHEFRTVILPPHLVSASTPLSLKPGNGVRKEVGHEAAS